MEGAYGLIRAEVRTFLKKNSDAEYRQFAAKLLPGIQGIQGVRLPRLRCLAKQLSQVGAEEYLQAMAGEDQPLFEETMLEGLVIGYAKLNFAVRLGYVADFVPKIGNWSICDSFCSSLKFNAANEAQLWRFLQPYFVSKREFSARFAVVMALDFFVREDYLERVLLALASVRQEGYYAKMAVAWAVSVCFAKFPDRLLAYLQDNPLDDFTYHKALQKINESQRVTRADKAIIRGLRRSKK